MGFWAIMLGLVMLATEDVQLTGLFCIIVGAGVWCAQREAR